MLSLEEKQMTLTVEEISKKQFDNKMRGYNPSEVNEFLRQVASEFQALQAKNHELTETIKANEEKLKYFTDLKDSLNKSILVAQEAADKVKNNAKREAEIMIREAQKQATDIVSEANDQHCCQLLHGHVTACHDNLILTDGRRLYVLCLLCVLPDSVFYTKTLCIVF